LFSLIGGHITQWFLHGLFWGFKKQNAHLGGAFFFPTPPPLFCFLQGYLAGITEKKEKNSDQVFMLRQTCGLGICPTLQKMKYLDHTRKQFIASCNVSALSGPDI
jgi:hypothetical protein